MKKKIFAVILILMLVSICQSEAATTYQLEIGGINYSGVADLTTNQTHLRHGENVG